VVHDDDVDHDDGDVGHGDDDDGVQSLVVVLRLVSLQVGQLVALQDSLVAVLLQISTKNDEIGTTI
jgi:hypothetical protein